MGKPNHGPAPVPSSPEASAIAQAMLDESPPGQPAPDPTRPSTADDRAARLKAILDERQKAIDEFAAIEFSWSARATTKVQLERGKATEDFAKRILGMGKRACEIHGRPYDRGKYLDGAFKAVAGQAATMGDRNSEAPKLRWIGHLLQSAIPKQLGEGYLEKAIMIPWSTWIAHILRKPTVVDWTNLVATIDPAWVDWLRSLCDQTLGDSKAVRASYQALAAKIAEREANRGKSAAQIERERLEADIAKARALNKTAESALDSALAGAIQLLSPASIRASIRTVAASKGIDPVSLATEGATAIDPSTVESKTILDLIDKMVRAKRYQVVRAIFRDAEAILAGIAAREAADTQPTVPIAMAG